MWIPPEVHDPVVMRVEGDNEAGLAYRLTQQWALAGINLQGVTMSVLGNKFVGLAAFDSVEYCIEGNEIAVDVRDDSNWHRNTPIHIFLGLP